MALLPFRTKSGWCQAAALHAPCSKQSLQHASADATSGTMSASPAIRGLPKPVLAALVQFVLFEGVGVGLGGVGPSGSQVQQWGFGEHFGEQHGNRS